MNLERSFKGRPLFIYGTIDSQGTIEAVASYGSNESHALALQGHKWRFCVPTQEWTAPRGNSELTEEEEILVTDYLEKNGYVDSI
jgi:hypothetical protein